MTHIFNLCIHNNDYPEQMKIMKIIPIIKQDKDLADPENSCDIYMANVFFKNI